MCRWAKLFLCWVVWCAPPALSQTAEEFLTAAHCVGQSDGYHELIVARGYSTKDQIAVLVDLNETFWNRLTARIHDVSPGVSLAAMEESRAAGKAFYWRLARESEAAVQSGRAISFEEAIAPFQEASYACIDAYETFGNDAP